MKTQKFKVKVDKNGESSAFFFFQAKNVGEKKKVHWSYISFE